MSNLDYLSINKKNWNSRVSHHVQSEFYNMPAFLEGTSSLQSIELALLGNIAGKRILHLQCHFGQDSISLARMGALVTGVDFSEQAIDKATELAAQLNADAKFICTDIYSLPKQLQGEFDIVFTSYGTIGWLPDIDKWAAVINHFLAPSGKFVFVEFHPFIWMYNNEFTAIEYHYHNQAPIIETHTGTYANPKAEVELSEIGWNHSLSEVFTALINQNLWITDFKEYDYSPFNCFEFTEMVETGKFRIKNMDNKVPMVYSLVAVKK